MSHLCIFAATEMEARPVRNIVEGTDVVLIAGGMGPKNARTKAEAAFSAGSERKPDGAVVVGLCGGLTASLSERRIVIYTECLSTEAGCSSRRCSQTFVDSVAAM